MEKSIDLHAGDHVFLFSGKKLVIESVAKVNETTVNVFNFTFKESISYCVGNQAVLVHNASSNPYAAADNDPRRTKHVAKGHINRNKYPEKSKYVKSNQIDKTNKRIPENPDKVTVQSRGRVLYQKDMKRKIAQEDKLLIG